MSWPLSATGNIAPTINIQGSATSLTGPQGDDFSFTYAVDVDTQGYQYALTYWALNPSGTQYAVCVYAPNATGNVAAIRRFEPTNLTTLTVESAYGGICVDYTGNCYVGIFDNSNSNNYIYKFPATSSGSVTGTIFVSIPSTDSKWGKPGIASLYFDAVRAWIWVCMNGGSGGVTGLIAYDLNGVQQAYMTPAILVNPTQIAIGPDGNIWVADTAVSTPPFPAAILEFGLNASVATRELTVSDNSWAVDYLGVGVDQNGIIYVSTGHGQSAKVQTYAANANGNVTGTYLTQITGAATYLATMVSGAVTFPAQLRLST